MLNSYTSFCFSFSGFRNICRPVCYFSAIDLQTEFIQRKKRLIISINPVGFLPAIPVFVSFSTWSSSWVSFTFLLQGILIMMVVPV